MSKCCGIEEVGSLASLQLGFARRRGHDAIVYVISLRDKIASGKVTLEALGTTKQELALLEVAGNLAFAKLQLSFARQKGQDAAMYAKAVREKIARGKVTLEALGTDEQELSELEAIKTS